MNSIKELFRFIITGGISFVVDYATMIIFKEFVGVNYLIASTFGFIISVIVNYYICIMWVFENANRGDKKTAIIFLGSSIIGLGLTVLLMWIIVDFMKIYYMVAKVIVTIIVMLWNYYAKKKAVNL